MLELCCDKLCEWPPRKKADLHPIQAAGPESHTNHPVPAPPSPRHKTTHRNLRKSSSANRMYCACRLTNTETDRETERQREEKLRKHSPFYIILRNYKTSPVSSYQYVCLLLQSSSMYIHVCTWICTYISICIHIFMCIPRV